MSDEVAAAYDDADTNPSTDDLSNLVTNRLERVAIPWQADTGHRFTAELQNDDIAGEPVQRWALHAAPLSPVSLAASVNSSVAAAQTFSQIFRLVDWRRLALA